MTLLVEERINNAYENRLFIRFSSNISNKKNNIMKIFFISKWANWQKYRLEVLTKYANVYDSKVEILTTGHLKTYLNDNDRVKYKIFKSIFSQKSKFSFMPGIIRYIITNKPDVVLALNNSTQFTEYLALWLCRLLKIRFVWWTHGYDHGISNLPPFLKRLKETFVIFHLSKSNSIIVFADKGKDYLVSKGINASKIFVALNTLDTSKLFEEKSKLLRKMDYQQIIENLNLSTNDKVILFSGQLNKHKKVENAIYACENVKKVIPSIKLVIIGNGPEYKSLKEIAEQRLPHNSIFVGDLFDDFELSKWFSIAHLYIMPGYVGLAIIHAFCFSLPLLTEDLTYHSPEIHFLKNGKNGYLVEENNIKELSEKIIELLSDNEKREAFSKQALSTAQNEGNINNMISQMHKAIEI